MLQGSANPADANPAESTTEVRPGDSARYSPLAIVLAAVCGGILADRFLGLPLAVWWPATGMAWTGWLVCRQRGLDRAAAVVLLTAVACCAGAWHHCRWSLFEDDDLGAFARPAGQPACVKAIVTKGPRRLPAGEFNPMRAISGGDRTRLEVEATAIRDGARWRPASGRAQLYVDGHLLGVHAGDGLQVFAQLTAPRPAHNPGEFDFARHGRTRRIRSRLRASYPDCVTVVRRGGGLSPTRWIESLRSGGDKLLWEHLDHRRSGLAAAVLLGAREELSGERARAFVETGTVHLLAISGLHVGIVAGALLLVLRFACVPRSRALLAAAAVTVVYTLLTDARPPAIRAMILVLILCAGHYLGRSRVSFNSLAAAGLVVLALNPAGLFQTGVQLSFIAVAGIMWFGPRWIGSRGGLDSFQRLVMEGRGWVPRMLWIPWRSARHLTLISLLIWLVTLPLIMARFHLVTPVAAPLNTLLWVPMTLALTAGLGVLVFGWFLTPAAVVLAAVCDGSLWLLEWCVDWARRLPGSHFWVPGPAEWWLVGFYGGLALWAAFPAVRPSRRWCLVLLAGWSAVGLGTQLFSGDAGRLRCNFFSVGHGAAIALELPSGETILYDAGQFGSPEFGAQSVAAGLWSRGITHLDAVVLSHADVDHYNMLPELLRRFSVGRIYVSPVMFDEPSRAVVALQEAIGRVGVPVEEICLGDRLPGGACRIEVLHPPQGGMPGRDNADSIVLAVEYLGRRILLPGDLEAAGLDALLAGPPWDCDVLLAPHHGSLRSDAAGLAAWCTPEWVVTSGSLRADFPEASARFGESEARVLHTSRDGAVTVTISPGGIDSSSVEVETFLGSR